MRDEQTQSKSQPSRMNRAYDWYHRNAGWIHLSIVLISTMPLIYFYVQNLSELSRRRNVLAESRQQLKQVEGRLRSLHKAKNKAVRFEARVNELSRSVRAVFESYESVDDVAPNSSAFILFTEKFIGVLDRSLRLSLPNGKFKLKCQLSKYVENEKVAEELKTFDLPDNSAYFIDLIHYPKHLDTGFEPRHYQLRIQSNNPDFETFQKNLGAPFAPKFSNADCDIYCSRKVSIFPGELDGRQRSKMHSNLLDLKQGLSSKSEGQLWQQVQNEGFLLGYADWEIPNEKDEKIRMFLEVRLWSEAPSVVNVEDVNDVKWWAQDLLLKDAKDIGKGRIRIKPMEQVENSYD